MHLTKFPLPPSVNEYLSPSGKRGRFVKNETYKIFERKVFVWSLKHNSILHDMRLLLKDKKDPLSIDITFVFHKPRIICKDGSIKLGKNDATNFVKPFLDVLSKLLGIDDSLFNDNQIKRAYCERESDQQVIFEIKETKIFSIEDIKQSHRIFTEGFSSHK